MGRREERENKEEMEYVYFWF